MDSQPLCVVNGHDFVHKNVNEGNYYKCTFCGMISAMP